KPDRGWASWGIMLCMNKPPGRSSPSPLPVQIEPRPAIDPNLGFADNLPMQKTASFLFLFVSFVLTSACGGTVASGSSGAGGQGSTGATGTGGGGGAPNIQCNANPQVFPTFDKSCTTLAECIPKLHIVDCCGTRLAIGLNASQNAAFNQAEAICDAMYSAGGGCGPG